MTDLPEKINVWFCSDDRCPCVINKDVPYLHLAGKQAEIAVHRYNIHKRLVETCDTLMKELDNIVAEREGDALVIWLRIVQEAEQLLKEAQDDKV